MKFSKVSFLEDKFQSFIPKHFADRPLTNEWNIILSSDRWEHADQMLSSGVLISENEILEILQNKFSEFY